MLDGFGTGAGPSPRMLGPAGGRTACRGAPVWALAALANSSNASSANQVGRASHVSDVSRTSLDFMTPP